MAKHLHHHRRGSEQRRRGPSPHKAALLIKGHLSLALEPTDDGPPNLKKGRALDKSMVGSFNGSTAQTTAERGVPKLLVTDSSAVSSWAEHR